MSNKIELTNTDISDIRLQFLESEFLYIETLISSKIKVQDSQFSAKMPNLLKKKPTQE